MSKRTTKNRNPLIEALTGFRRTPEPAAGAGRAYPTPPSRKTRKPITVWQDELAVRQLKALALERGVPQQKIVAEALNLLFAKYGKPPVAT